MKEKYSGYYKKLKLFQDPSENPENEGNRGIVVDDLTGKYIWLYGNSLLNCEIRDCIGLIFLAFPQVLFVDYSPIRIFVLSESFLIE